jgi:hypothetical protein
MNDPFRPYRKAFRAWRSLRRLDREREHYRREFDRRGLSVPDPDAIMRAVKARRPRLARLPRGALHTLAIFHDYNRERTAFMPALGKFGEAVCYDWRDRFDHGSKDWRKKLKGEMNRDLLEFARALSKKRPLGFIFTYLSGELVTPETVRELSNHGAPMVNLALNDREAFSAVSGTGRRWGYATYAGTSTCAGPAPAMPSRNIAWRGQSPSTCLRGPTRRFIGPTKWSSRSPSPSSGNAMIGVIGMGG